MAIESVMIVDDSEVQCHFAVELCQKLLPSVNIRYAYDGQSALDQMLLSPVHLLLVDLEMPIMDGVELLSKVSESQLANAAIVMSAQDDALISSVAIMAKAQGMEVLGSIKKPLTEAHLLQALNQYSVSVDATVLASPSATVEITTEDLEQALDRKAFFCQFQPKVTAKGMILKGVEALARWQHADLGRVPPVQFIPIAEASGLIDRLTFLLLEQAMAYKQQWKQKGLNIELAFNLSPFSLHNAHLVKSIQAIVHRYGIAPKELTFEVTENALFEDLGQALHTLARLRLSGFKLAIDDYGTGFANAEQLSRIPATELKLDRSLVHGVTENRQLEAIVRSTVKLAKELNLTTVAEGVESMSDYHTLCALQVDLIQGYYFAKPLDANDLMMWMNKDLNLVRAEARKSQPY